MSSRVDRWLCAVVLAGATAACGGGDSAGTEGSYLDDIRPGAMATYVAPTGHFAIDYPVGWKVEEKSRNRVFFESPPEHPGDSFTENVLVTVAPNGFLNFDLGQVTLFTKAAIGSFATDPEIFHEGAAQLGRLPAEEMMFRGTRDQTQCRWWQIWGVTSERVYVVTFTASDWTFDAYLDVADEMIGSFVAEPR